jgi:hypothetical protein
MGFKRFFKSSMTENIYFSIKYLFSVHLQYIQAMQIFNLAGRAVPPSSVLLVNKAPSVVPAPHQKQVLAPVKLQSRIPAPALDASPRSPGAYFGPLLRF